MSDSEKEYRASVAQRKIYELAEVMFAMNALEELKEFNSWLGYELQDKNK